MTTEKRAKELAEIDPPRSVVRVSDFLRDLTRSGMPRFEPMPVGGGPMLVIAGRGPFLPGGGFLEAFARLTAHYAVQAEDLEAFAIWLALWTEKYQEMEVIEDPTVYDTPAFPAKTRASGPFVVQAPQPAPSPVEEPLRRTRRREDPLRRTEPVADDGSPNPAAPTRDASEPPRRTFEPTRQPSAANRPLRREPVPEPDVTEPLRRIDLQTLVRRAQTGTFGGGMMVAGAMLAPRAEAATLAFPSAAFPSAGLPTPPPAPTETVVRTVVVDRAGNPVSTSFSRGTFARALPPSPSLADAPNATEAALPAPEEAFLQPDEPRPGSPARPLRPAPGMPSLTDGPSSFLEGPSPLASPTDPLAVLPETSRIPIRLPGGRTFPTVATILGMVGLSAAASAATPHHHRHPVVDRPLPGPKGDDGFDPRGDEPEPPGAGTILRPHRPQDRRADGYVRPVAEASPADQPALPAGREEGPASLDRGFGKPRGFAVLGALGLAAPALGVAYPGDPDRPERGRFRGIGPTVGFALDRVGESAEGGSWRHDEDADAPEWAPTRIVSSNQPEGRRARGFGPIPNDPRYGQITLIAPPLTVASAEGERAGSAVQFEWSQLASSSGELDADGAAGLARALPAGAQAIYPALPPGSAGTNLRLSPGLLTQILERGYGPQAAARARSIASNTPAPPRGGATTASLVPIGRPMGASADGGVLGGRGDGIADAGGAQAKRGGALDFLGLPVRLAPALGGRPELRQQQMAQTAGADLAAGRPVRPEAFAPLQKRLFPGLGSVTVEPDAAKWRKAAPGFGLRGADPTTVLSNDATLRPFTSAAPVPPSTKSRPGPLEAAAARFSPGGAGHGPGLSALGRTPSVSLDHGGSLPRIGGLATGLASGGGRPGFPGRGIGSSSPIEPTLGTGALGAHHAPSLGVGAASGFSSPVAPIAPAVSSPSRGVSTPAFGSAQSFRPVSQVGPPGTGRTTSTAAPATESGGHVPFVSRPAVPSAPSLPPAARPAAFGGPGRAARPGVPSLGAPARRSPILPSRPAVSAASPSRPRWGSTTPEMLYTPAAAPRTAGAGALAIQRAVGGSPSPSASSAEAKKNPSRGPQENGKSEAAEIDSLATEVWSLLRRRLSYEAERRGRY